MTGRVPKGSMKEKSSVFWPLRPIRWVRRVLGKWLRRVVIAFVLAMFGGVTLYAFVNPPTTLYMAAERARLNGVKHDWVDLSDVAPVMARSVVAAEDANFCSHWGFDMSAIRAVIARGERRGASTISQQVVKNTYLWPARSWPRKALEALITPVVELIWSKRRIVEVYLNVAEFDEGVFGIKAAARHYFGVTPDRLTAHQAALLAAILPNPKDRSAARPGNFTRARAARIADGAATILRDGRAECFES